MICDICKEKKQIIYEVLEMGKEPELFCSEKCLKEYFK